jgi:hypothetical protein
MKIGSGLVIEDLPDGGCLILDERGHQSHALRSEAAAVLRQIEQGTTEVAAISLATRLDAGLVEAALADLAAAGVLELDASGPSRREWLARAATVAGAVVGLKLVETIVTPSPAAAQSLLDGPVGG